MLAKDFYENRMEGKRLYVVEENGEFFKIPDRKAILSA